MCYIPLDFVFSPDVKYVAAISEDGCLRVIDALAEQYDPLNCVLLVILKRQVTGSLTASRRTLGP